MSRHLEAPRGSSSRRTRCSARTSAASSRDWDVTEQTRGRGHCGVWQLGDWEYRIRAEEDHFRHRGSIHLNPILHAYVEHPADSAWPSFHRHVRVGLAPPDMAGIESGGVTGDRRVNRPCKPMVSAGASARPTTLQRLVRGATFPWPSRAPSFEPEAQPISFPGRPFPS
jgi:hypothetical protein